MGRASDSGTCGRFIKYSLFFTNFITLIGGIVLLTLGIWFITEKGFIEEILGDALFYWGAVMFLVGGSILSVVCFLGCYGAVKEIRCMLITYFFATLILLAILLTATVFCFLFHKDAETNIGKAMNSSIKLYDTDSVVKAGWDRVQKYMYCCGIHSHKDWGKIPQSCCAYDNSGKECSPDNENFQSRECLNSTVTFVGQHAAILGASGVIGVFLTFFAMIFSCALACF